MVKMRGGVNDGRAADCPRVGDTVRGDHPMRRAATLLAILCLLTVAFDNVAARAVDVSTVDPSALFEALAGTAMSDVELPGSLRAEDADVVGFADNHPMAGNVGITWVAEAVYINYFVFETARAAMDSYAALDTAGADGKSLPQVNLGAGAMGYCRPSRVSDAGETITETCFTVRGNIIVAAFGEAASGFAAALVHAGVLHLDIVASSLATDGTADASTPIAAAEASAQAEVAGSSADGEETMADPLDLLQALVAAEMSNVELPGFLDEADAKVERYADEAVADAVGGVSITWPAPDEDSVLSLVVYATEAEANEMYATLEESVRADLGTVPTFEYYDGTAGLCDVSSMGTPVEGSVESCHVRIGNVIVTGVADGRFGDAGGLAHAGVLHLELVVGSMVGGTDVGPGTPVAGDVAARAAVTRPGTESLAA